MKVKVGILRCLLLAVAMILLLGSTSPAEEKVRSCTVKEVVKGGMYVYLRCQENGRDIWLATVAREFKADEVVSFANAPPMNNFYSKQLDRLFPEVIFTDLLPPAVKK